MLQREDPKGESTRVSEPAAARLLARASELDVAFRGNVAIAELRAAALEAGISQAAFEAALAELQAEDVVRAVPPPKEKRRNPVKWALAAVLGVFFFGSYVVPRGQGVAEAKAPMLEETVFVRCVSPQEAVRLLRPILIDRQNRVSLTPADPAGIIRIRATEEQLKRVRFVLEQYEGAPGTTCPVRPLAPPR